MKDPRTVLVRPLMTEKSMQQKEDLNVVTFEVATGANKVEIRQAVENGLEGLDLAKDWPIDVALVRKIHDAGLKLFVWTVDDPAVARRLADVGVDGITTNRPGWLREQLAS